jgi:hypothetical protein
LITNSKEQIPLDKLTVAQLFPETPRFYGTQRFVTVFKNGTCAEAVVMWVPVMVRPQVAEGGDGLQIWRVAANISSVTKTK